MGQALLIAAVVWFGLGLVAGLLLLGIDVRERLRKRPAETQNAAQPNDAR